MGDIEDNLQQPRRARVGSSFVLDKSRSQALRWANVSMTVENSTVVLDKVWGEALPGESTAIMGPSGSGKTTLFRVLSGRAPTGRNIEHKGDLLYGNSKIESLPGGMEAFRKRIAYVPQFDILPESSTPWEALRFSARLRLPAATTSDEIEDLVNDYITNLGLTKCADTVIGSDVGISGGERKRTNIGIELVTNPGIIFCDEPTSGLDSFVSKQIMTLLNSVAKAGNVVIFTIHQPAYSVFATFTKVFLLNGGKVMYCGLTSDTPDDFANYGYPVPKNTNPADWILEVAQEDRQELEECGFFPKDVRDFSGPPPLRISYYNLEARGKGASVFTQSILLFKRQFLSFKRDFFKFILSIVVQILLAFMTGIPYYTLGRLPFNDIKDMQYILKAAGHVFVIVMFSLASLALPVFAYERPLFIKEYFTKTYGIFPYFLSKFVQETVVTAIACCVSCLITFFLIDFPISFGRFFVVVYLVAENSIAVSNVLGSLFKDPLAASGMLMLVCWPQILWAGAFVPVSFFPAWTLWISKICFLRYASNLMILYLFGDCAADGQKTCVDFLFIYRVYLEDYWLYWIGLLLLFVANKGLAMYFLWIKSRNYA